MPVMPDFWKSTEYSGLWPLNVAAVTVTPHLNGTWKFGAADAVAEPARVRPSAGSAAAAANTASRRNLDMGKPPARTGHLDPPREAPVGTFSVQAPSGGTEDDRRTTRAAPGPGLGALGVRRGADVRRDAPREHALVDPDRHHPGSV